MSSGHAAPGKNSIRHASNEKHTSYSACLLIMNPAMLPAFRDRSGHAGATKLFVLVRRPAYAELPPGFLPKRGLQLRMQKGLQVRTLHTLMSSI